jgi:hypothetical protein
MRDIIILKVEDSLGVLNNSTGVRGHEVLDGLGHTVLGHESSGLRSSDLRSSRVLAVGNAQKTAVLLG